MTASPTVERTFHFARKSKGRTKLRSGEKPSLPEGRLPRITRLMALAIHFDDLLASGQVTSQAELARLGGVTRARLTQITNLLLLAPDIQEQILQLPRVTSGRDTVTERELRTIAQISNWREQRRLWRRTFCRRT